MQEQEPHRSNVYSLLLGWNNGFETELEKTSKALQVPSHLQQLEAQVDWRPKNKKPKTEQCLQDHVVVKTSRWG